MDLNSLIDRHVHFRPQLAVMSRAQSHNRLYRRQQARAVTTASRKHVQLVLTQREVRLDAFFQALAQNSRTRKRLSLGDRRPGRSDLPLDPIWARWP